MDDDELDVPAAADFLQCSTGHIYKLLREGEITRCRRGRGQMRTLIRLSSLKNYKARSARQEKRGQQRCYRGDVA